MLEGLKCQRLNVDAALQHTWDATLGGENIARALTAFKENLKLVLIGIVFLLVVVGFVVEAIKDPFIENSTLLSLVVVLIPTALGVGLLLRAFDII